MVRTGKIANVAPVLPNNTRMIFPFRKSVKFDRHRRTDVCARNEEVVLVPERKYRSIQYPGGEFFDYG